MDLPLRVDAHNSIPICGRGQSPARIPSSEPAPPRVPALPKELDGVGITPSAVARVIADLTRSGYRPLHARRAEPKLSSIPRARVAPGRDA
jgi:hypothetical protein